MLDGLNCLAVLLALPFALVGALWAVGYGVTHADDLLTWAKRCRGEIAASMLLVFALLLVLSNMLQMVRSVPA